MTVVQRQAITVTAEWALWGKEEGDTRDYHLLRCSDGMVSADEFVKQLDRYSPGTLTELPQVTVSWIKDNARQGSHLAIAFHETAASDPQGAPVRGRRDAGGREIVFVRYFCVPYEDLTGCCASYEALYHAFRDVMLPERGGRPLEVSLRAGPVRLQPQLRPHAQLVAAQLLTGRPVCLAGATESEDLVRLQFLDQVMSLLPYGMRNTLSASTWVNNSHKGHNFRLFFASAPREAADGFGYGGADADGDFGAHRPADIVVNLGTDPAGGSLTDHARRYLSWVQQAGPHAIGQLARWTPAIRLSDKREIAATIRRLPSPHGEDIQSILGHLAEALDRQDLGSLTECAQDLERQLADQDVAVDRAQCSDLIRSNGLMRDIAEWIPGPVRDGLLDSLVKVATEAPVSYAGFRHVMDLVQGRPSERVLTAITRASTPGSLAWVLACKLLHQTDSQLFAAVEKQASPPDGLLRGLLLDASSQQQAIARDDTRAVFDFAWRYMVSHSPQPRLTLRSLSYLAPVLVYLNPGQPARSVLELRLILGAVYGRRLGLADIRDVLRWPGFARLDPEARRVLAGAAYTMTRWKVFLKKEYFDADTAGYVPSGRVPPPPASRPAAPVRPRKGATVTGAAVTGAASAPGKAITVLDSPLPPAGPAPREAAAPSALSAPTGPSAPPGLAESQGGSLVSQAPAGNAWAAPAHARPNGRGYHPPEITTIKIVIVAVVAIFLVIGIYVTVSLTG